MKKERYIVYAMFLVLLFPLVLGLICWNQLPEKMPVQFSFTGEVTNYASKRVAVVFLPLVCVVGEFYMISALKKQLWTQGKNRKFMVLLLSLLPFCSLFSTCVMYYIVFFQ